jgi:hypothetical protein
MLRWCIYEWHIQRELEFNNRTAEIQKYGNISRWNCVNDGWKNVDIRMKSKEFQSGAFNQSELEFT